MSRRAFLACWGGVLAVVSCIIVPAHADEKTGQATGTARRDYCLFKFGEDVFLVGGEVNGSPLTRVERYMLPAGVATPAVDLELSVPRTGAASVTTTGGVFIVGGRTADGQPLASVEWVQADDRGQLEGPTQIEPGTGLNQPRSGHMAIAIGSWVYVLGGSGPDGVLRSIERAPVTPEGSLGRFEEVASSSLTIPRTRAICVRLGSRLLVGGGLSGPGQVLDTWEQASIDDSGRLGPFEVVPGVRLNEARESAGVIERDGRVILVGGGAPGVGTLRSTEMATWSADTGLSTFQPGPELDRPRMAPLLWVASGDVRVLDGEWQPETLAWSTLLPSIRERGGNSPRLSNEEGGQSVVASPDAAPSILELAPSSMIDWPEATSDATAVPQP